MPLSGSSLAVEIMTNQHWSGAAIYRCWHCLRLDLVTRHYTVVPPSNHKVAPALITEERVASGWAGLTFGDDYRGSNGGFGASTNLHAQREATRDGQVWLSLPAGS